MALSRGQGAPPSPAHDALLRGTNELDLFAVNLSGALDVFSVVGFATWSSAVRLSADGTAIAGDPVAAASQSTNQLDAFVSANAGLLEAVNSGTSWSTAAKF